MHPDTDSGCDLRHETLAYTHILEYLNGTSLILLGYALAALMGLALGTLGGGGSTLTVPIFVYVMGFGAKEAIAMSFPVVGAASLAGVLSHAREGQVRWHTALILGPATMLAAFLSARFLSPLWSGSAQLAFLAVVMMAASLSMFRTAGRSGAPPEVPRGELWLVPIGVGVGTITGLAGVGGGFLIVPALVLFAGIPIKEAIGTSLLVIVLNTAAGFVGYAGQVDIPWGPVALFTAVALCGILMGTRVVRVATPAQLKRAFAIFLLVVGGYVLYQNRDALPGGESPAPVVQP